jgi:hypothetical protein
MKNLITVLALVLSANLLAKDMHFVHLKVKTFEERSRLANIIHIDHVIEDSVYAVVNEDDLKVLKKEIGHLLVETHIYHIPETKDDAEIEFPRKDEKFHTYKETMAVMDNLARQYPKITKIFSLGTTIEGRDIKGIRITGEKNFNSKAFIPGIFFIGAHHAREHLST